MSLQYITNPDGTLGHLKVTLPLTTTEATQLYDWHYKSINIPFHDVESRNLISTIVNSVGYVMTPTNPIDLSMWEPLISGNYTHNGVSGNVDISEVYFDLVNYVTWTKPFDITKYYTVENGIYKNPQAYQPLLEWPVGLDPYFDFTRTGKDMEWVDPCWSELLSFYYSNFNRFDSQGKQVIYNYAQSQKARADYIGESQSNIVSNYIEYIIDSYNRWITNPIDPVNPINPGDTGIGLKDLLDRLTALENRPVCTCTDTTVDLKSLEQRIQVQEHDTSIHDAQIKDLQTQEANIANIVSIHERELLEIKTILKI